MKTLLLTIFISISLVFSIPVYARGSGGGGGGRSSSPSRSYSSPSRSAPARSAPAPSKQTTSRSVTSSSSSSSSGPGLGTGLFLGWLLFSSSSSNGSKSACASPDMLVQLQYQYSCSRDIESRNAFVCGPTNGSFNKKHVLMTEKTTTPFEYKVPETTVPYCSDPKTVITQYEMLCNVSKDAVSSSSDDWKDLAMECYSPKAQTVASVSVSTDQEWYEQQAQHRALIGKIILAIMLLGAAIVGGTWYLKKRHKKKVKR